jgi:diguanylate cyclase (GGDEF)-like protein
MATSTKSSASTSRAKVTDKAVVQRSASLWHRIDAGTFLFQRINALSITTTYLLATLMLVLIGAADYWSSVELMLAPFYAIPCCLVDWRIGRSPALLYGIFASIVQWFIGTYGGHRYSHAFYLYWDIVLNLVFYGVLIWIVAKLRLALEMEQMLSRVDFLTRLANRKTFVAALEADLAVRRARGYAVAVVTVRWDRFDAFVEAQGYSEGDLALSALADLLRRSPHAEGLLGRTETATFALVLPDTNPKSCDAAVATLTRRIDFMLLARGWQLNYSASCARFEAAPQAALFVLGKAGVLLDEAKHMGKNRCASRAWDAQGQATQTTPTAAGPYVDFELTSQLYLGPESRP